MKLIDNSLPSFRVPGRVPQWVVWSIAGVLFVIAWSSVDVWTRWLALRDLADHVDRWDENGVLQQDTNYACVPMSIAMLLKSEGIDTTTYEVAKVAGTDIRGTGATGIVKAGEHFGFKVEHRVMGFNEFFNTNLPTIIEFRYNGIKHAAFAQVWPEQNVIEVKDPVQGLLYFNKETADEYFGSEEWQCFLFERQSM